MLSHLVDVVSCRVYFKYLSQAETHGALVITFCYHGEHCRSWKCLKLSIFLVVFNHKAYAVKIKNSIMNIKKTSGAITCSDMIANLIFCSLRYPTQKLSMAFHSFPLLSFLHPLSHYRQLLLLQHPRSQHPRSQHPLGPEQYCSSSV